MIGPAGPGRPGGTWSRWIDSLSDALPGGHLSLDAVVAHVDGELPAPAATRAGAHVDRCLTCAAEVAAQRQARRRLRAAETPGAPSSLLSSLRAIPDTADLPPLGEIAPIPVALAVAPPTATPPGTRRPRRRGPAPDGPLS